MNITNLALKEDCEQISVHQAEIHEVFCRQTEEFTANTPALLPKEEYCCDRATD